MYTIQQFSKMVGLNPSTLRFYEKKGLFQTARTESNYRQYKASDTALINQLKSYLELGFTVNEAIDIIHHKKQVDVEELLLKQIQNLELEELKLHHRKKKLQVMQDEFAQLKQKKCLIKEVGKLSFCCVHASELNDFSVSKKNEQLLSAYVSYLPISGYGILFKDHQFTNYCLTISKKDAKKYSLFDGSEVIESDNWIELVTQEIHYKEAFEMLDEWLNKNHKVKTGYMIQVPLFIENQRKGSSIHHFYISVK